MIHHPTHTEVANSALTHEQQIRATYDEGFMNLDDNLFGLDSESRDLVFGTPHHAFLAVHHCPSALICLTGRNGMNDSAVPNQHHYETSPMQTDNADINNILVQMPTPVSSNMRAAPDGSNFMSPLQVDQEGNYDRMNGVAYSHQEGQEVFPQIERVTS